LKLKHGFSISGKAAGSLLTGELSLSEDSGLSTGGPIEPGDIRTSARNSFYHVVPAVELEAGVSWERKLLDKLNLKVFLGYQFSEFFGGSQSLDAQPIFFAADDDLNPLYGARGRTALDRPIDIGIHGLVFRIKLDF